MARVPSTGKDDTREKWLREKMGVELGQAGATIRLLCESGPNERERGGGLDRIFPDCFPREFGQAVEERLGRSGLSE